MKLIIKNQDHDDLRVSYLHLALCEEHAPRWSRKIFDLFDCVITDLLC